MKSDYQFYTKQETIEDLMVEVAEAEVQISELMKRSLSEATDTSNLSNNIDKIIQHLEAAKRGLGITNKLTDPGRRAQHKSKVMGNMNRIRAFLNRVTKEEEARNKSADQYGNESELDLNKKA